MVGAEGALKSVFPSQCGCARTASITDQRFDPEVGSLPLMGSVLSFSFSFPFSFICFVFSQFVKVYLFKKCLKLNVGFLSLRTISIIPVYLAKLYLSIFFQYGTKKLHQSTAGAKSYILLVCDG